MFGSHLLLASIALGLATAGTLPNKNSIISTGLKAKRVGNCNTADNRKCWRSASSAEPDGFDITTDSETIWPSNTEQGQATVTTTLTISEKTLSPDGTPKVMQVVNGIYPGPVIEANWGDVLIIDVVNNLKDNGTSMHWHGVIQANSTTQDGVNGITECPIAPGGTRRYQFIATQHGTSWYHSHYSGQYGDGVMGTLKINGPASLDYEEDLGTFPITDWYTDNTYQAGFKSEPTIAGPPRARGALINGKMKSAPGVTGFGAYEDVKIVKGKTYRLRLINTSVDMGFKVSLDNHPFSVIAADFVPIEPWNTTWLFMGIGQRYDVVFTANQTSDRYWFRVEIPTAYCGGNAMSTPAKGNTPAKHSIFAIFSYSDAPNPNDEPISRSQGTYSLECADEKGMAPITRKDIPSEQFVFKGNATDLMNLRLSSKDKHGRKINSWVINDKEIDIQWENPTLKYVLNNDLATLQNKAGSNIYQLSKPNEFYFWIIQNDGGNPHPIHLHGHDFHILGQAANTKFTDKNQLQFNNPLRRDVAMLPANGYLAIAIYTNNPGVWLMHCHIAWHISQGLGVQFVEREEEIVRDQLAGLEAMNSSCRAWDKWYTGNMFQQPDSGLRLF